MAYSLETAMAMPVAMAIWIALAASAAPAYENTWHIAQMAAETTLYSLENQYLYKASPFAGKSCFSTGLQVSPQAVLEIWALARDDAGMVLQAIQRGDSGGDPAAEEGSP